MRLQPLFAISFLAMLFCSCGNELPPGQKPEQTPAATAVANGIPRLGLFALKASNGQYVSCSMTPDSAGLITLRADRATVGPNEVFTGWYSDDGRFGIQAPNGKYIAVDRENNGLLVSDREYVGDWESFELVDAGNGLIALKNTNGQFVCPHYELPGARATQLVADRPEANEWERFTIVPDPAIGQ